MILPGNGGSYDICTRFTMSLPQLWRTLSLHPDIRRYHLAGIQLHGKGFGFAVPGEHPDPSFHVFTGAQPVIGRLLHQPQDFDILHPGCDIERALQRKIFSLR